MPTCPKCEHAWPDEQHVNAGKARWANVSKAKRKKAMKKVAKARWKKKRQTNDEASQAVWPKGKRQ